MRRSAGGQEGSGRLRPAEQQPARGHARPQSESGERGNRRDGQGSGILLKGRSRSTEQGMATPPGFHLRPSYQDSWGDNFIPRPGNREPCPPHAHQVGFGPDCLDPPRSHHGVAQWKTVCRSFFGRAWRSLVNELLYVAAGGREDHRPGIGEGLEVTRCVNELDPFFASWVIRPSRRMSVDFLRRSEEHTSELQSPCNLVCRLLLEKKKQ